MSSSNVSTGFVMDTSAWIEYFRKSSVGRRVAEYVDSEEILITSTLVIAEMKRRYEQQGRRDFDEHISFIRDISVVEPIVEEPIAILAGEIRQREAISGTSLIDCILIVDIKYGIKLLLIIFSSFQPLLRKYPIEFPYANSSSISMLLL